MTSPATIARSGGGTLPARQAATTGSDERRRTSRLASTTRRLKGHPWSAGSIVVGLALWELIVRGFDISPLLLSPPSVIFESLVDLQQSGELWKHSSVSAQQFLVGYLGCAAFAIPLGLLMGSVRVVRQVLQPWISALYATPSIALAPLFIIWLGFGVASKAGVVALVAFFPIVINTVAGVDSLEEYYHDVGSAFSANRREMFVKVLLPGSVPYIFTGLRLAVGRGLVGLVVADLFGARAGIGYLILRASQTFNTAELFAGTIVLAVSGVVLNGVLVRLELLISPWRRGVR